MSYITSSPQRLGFNATKKTSEMAYLLYILCRRRPRPKTRVEVAQARAQTAQPKRKDQCPTRLVEAIKGTFHPPPPCCQYVQASNHASVAGMPECMKNQRPSALLEAFSHRFHLTPQMSFAYWTTKNKTVGPPKTYRATFSAIGFQVVGQERVLPNRQDDHVETLCKEPQTLRTEHHQCYSQKSNTSIRMNTFNFDKKGNSNTQQQQ
jgi:hypothetical protein